MKDGGVTLAGIVQTRTRLTYPAASQVPVRTGAGVMSCGSHGWTVATQALGPAAVASPRSLSLQSESFPGKAKGRGPWGTGWPCQFLAPGAAASAAGMRPATPPRARSPWASGPFFQSVSHPAFPAIPGTAARAHGRCPRPSCTLTFGRTLAPGGEGWNREEGGSRPPPPAAGKVWEQPVP